MNANRNDCYRLIALAAIWLAASLADGAEPTAGIARLFEQGAKSTPPAVAAAKAHYEQLKRAQPNDRRVDYAYALVLLNQHRYHDALPLLSRYLESRDSAPSAAAVKIWILLQERSYPAALTDVEALSHRLPQETPGEPAAEYLDAARFLGAVVSYLEVVHPTAVDARLLAKSKNHVLVRLGAAYTPAFDEGRTAVIEQLATMRAQREAEQTKAVTAAEKKKSRLQDAAEQDRVKATEREERAEASSEQLREAQREMQVVEQQFNSLTQDRTRVGIQIITVQTQLQQLTLPIQQNYNYVSQGYTGPTSQTQYAMPAAMTIPQVAQARSAALTLAALNKQAFDMDRKLLALKSRMGQLSGTGAAQAETIAESTEDAEEADRHARKVEKRIHREETRSTPRAALLTAKMTQLSTYAPFPYEQEKERVLSWFSQ